MGKTGEERRDCRLSTYYSIQNGSPRGKLYYKNIINISAFVQIKIGA
jgi:hypothetical protein